MDNFKIAKLPSCRPASGIELSNATDNSATLRYTGVSSAQQYQVIVSTASIDLSDLTVGSIVYNDSVSGTTATISNLESSSRYYAYIRSICGNGEYSEWSDEFTFRTQCAAVTVADFGLETFEDPASTDCWTFGFGTPGTSTASAYAKREVANNTYGAYIKLSKESVAYTKNAAGVDTVYNDGAYAITPQLNMNGDDIRNYQISFMAATTSNVSTNLKRLNIGVMSSPNPDGFSSMQTLKTIDLDYAADSAELKSYTVSLANVEEDIFGDMPSYVIFQLKEATKHDSTNYVLIDNVSFEAASNCEQILEVKLDSVGIYDAAISWENSGAAEYQVIVSKVNSLRPDTITSTVFETPVSENATAITGLESNVVYYAYIRAICGPNEMAKWSNALRFRTSVAVPYDEPFSASTLSEGWSSKYYSAYSLPDSILASSFQTNNSYAMWEMKNSALPTGMSGYAAVVEPNSTTTSAFAWLISPVIDMTANADNFLELSFKMAGTNLYSSGYVAIYISVDGGAYKPLATWKSSSSTFPYSEITGTPKEYALNISKYAGKSISLAFGTYQYFSSSSSSTAPRLVVDDLSVHTTSAECRGIESITVNPSANSADVDLEIEGTPVKAVIMISENANFAPYIDSVEIENVYTYSFSGLTANTLYYVRAKQLDCANAEWKTVSFKTSCLPVDDAELPWQEGFESMEAGSSSSSAPDCWDILNANEGEYPYIYVNTNSTYVHSGSQSLYFVSSSSRYGYAILPPFSKPLNELVIDFSYKDESTSSSGYLDLGYMTNSSDESSFVSLASFTRSTSWVTINGYVLDSIPDAVASTARLAFRYGGASNNYYLGIDDITVRVIPSCPDINSILVDNIVADSARISVPDLGAPAYQFVVALSEIDLKNLQAEASKIIVNDTVEGDTALVLDGLTPATEYVVYARTICDEDKIGAWSEPVKFVSECATITIADGSPYTQKFNSITSGIPSCWDNSRGTTSTASSKWNYYATGYDGACLRFDSYNNSSGNTDTLVSPEFFLQEDAMLSFYWKNPSGGSAQVFVSADGGVTKTILESNLTNKSSWTLYEKDLSAYTGQTIQIFFASTSNYGSNDAYHYLDNFKVAAIPSCLPAAGLSASGITDQSASVSFNAVEGATYDIVVTSASVDIDHMSAADSAKIVLSSNAQADTVLSVDNLEASTTYYVFVRVHCNETSVSEWTNEYAFTTACGVVEVSADNLWSENFNSLTSGVPNCWNNSEGTTTSETYKWSSYSSGHEGKGLRFNSYLNSDGNTNILATPAIHLTEGLGFSFWWKNPQGGAAEVLISNNGGVTRTTLLTGMTGISAWTQYELDLSAYAGDTVIFYFKGTSNYGNNDAYLYLDDVALFVLPECKKVQSVAVSDITSTTAQLTFGLNGASEYEVVVMNKALAADTIPADAVLAYHGIVSSDTVALENLSGSTAYYAYVRALCDADIKGAWSDQVTFFTACDMISSFPWVENFEAYNAGSGSSSSVPAPQCYDILNGASGPYAYVSNDASTSYGFIGDGKYLFFNGSGGSTSRLAHVILPQMASVNNLQIRMQYAIEGSSSGDFVVGYMTDITSQNNFVAIATLPRPASTKTAVQSDWIGLDVIPADVADRARIAIQYTGTSYWYANIDNIEVTVQPDCREVKNLKASAVTSSSAEITFAPNPAPAFDFVLTSEAINPDTLAQVADALILHRDTIDTAYVELTGLQQQTTYYVYVQALCTDMTAGAWVSAQFTTKCLAAVPYIENFDNTSDRKAVYDGTSAYLIPSCWEEGYDSKSYVSYIDDNTSYSTYAYSATGALRLYSYYSSYSDAEYSSYVVLPELDAQLDTLQLTFKARAMYQGSSVTNYASSSYAHSIKVGTMTDPSDLSTFQLLDTYVLAEVNSTPSSADNYWEDVTIYLQGAQGKFIALVSDFNEKSNYVWIDDLEVSKAPDCLTPSAIKVAAGARAADVTWNSIANGFEVAFGAAGFAMPNADSIFVVEDTTGLHIADLEPSTAYDIYVRSVCGENAYSDWSAAISFSTACLMPELAEYHFDDAATRFVHHRDSIHVEEVDYYGYTESEYDDISDVYMENCWLVTGKMGKVNSSSYYTYETGVEGYYPFIVDNTESYIYARSETGALVFNYSSGMNTPLVAVMPALEADRDSLELEFWSRPGYESNGTMSGATTASARMLRVGLMTNPNDLSTFVPFETIRREAIIGTASSDIQNDQFWRRHHYSLAGTTAPYIAFVYDSTNVNNLFFVDDIRIKKMDACPEPNAPVVDSVTATTAVLSWEASAPAYEIALIHGTDTVKQSVVGKDSLRLNDLAPATSYIVRMRALCSDEEASPWSTAVAFTTECATIVVSDAGWSENFNALESGIPACWDNSEGTTASATYKWSFYQNGFDGAGLRFNSYSNSSDNTNILATPAFELTKDVELTFMWKNPTGGAADLLISTNGGVNKTSLGANLNGIADWTEYEIDLSAYTGQTIILYFSSISNYGNGDAYHYLDDISIAPAPTCRKVKNLSVSNISLTNVQVNFSYADGQAHNAHVAISKEAAFDPSTALRVDTVTADSTHTFSIMLEDKATYYVFVRQACDENDYSPWETVSFVTPYVIRYEAEFESTTLSNEWGRYSARMDDVLAGTTSLSSTSSSWSLVAADTVLSNIHFRGNIYGTSWTNWVVSPTISLAAPEGSNVQLHFDAGLTPYSTSQSYVDNVMME
jgi:hypothetical protein